jgi:hypothetical protein
MPVSDSVEMPHDCERLFCFWTGDNPMSPNRLKALTTMANSGLEVIFLTKENIEGWVLDSDPLHPAFQYLSAIHRADYLRMYFMHHYGGGYSDIKNINHSWIAAAEKLKTSGGYLNGYPEIGWRGVARVGGFSYIWLILNVKKLVGNCAYIARPRTDFTFEWREKANAVLTSNFEALRRNPAQHPEDFKGRWIDGQKSTYPLRWAQLLGDIFHPLCLKYSDHIIQTLNAPEFAIKY